ncbi:unnamed protein product [Taenia asiatica]|uniref:Internal head protein n=1 Tax=Taenia asiatica TaxID=60517 RepID=A0A0R3WCE7_TAEAS|nr:unnamed protein product [Taenia asiatica]
MSMKNGTFELKSNDGDAHLGHEDFDSRAEIHFTEIFRRVCKTLDSVMQAVNDAKLDNDNIFKTLKVGGLTRIPKKQELSQEQFKQLDEAVANSAALLASNLAGDR